MRFDKKELIKMLEERIEILERSALELNNPRMRKELRDLARDFRVEVERIQQEINKSCGRGNPVAAGFLWPREMKRKGRKWLREKKD